MIDHHSLGEQAKMQVRIVFSFLLGLSLPAQVNTGSITGAVIDSSGGLVQSAQLTLTNEDTGLALKGATTSAGRYVFAPLQPGRYRITVESAGFKRSERRGLLVQVGERLGVDITLEVGAVSETINVSEESPLLQTTNANLGQVIDQKKILELPLPGRDTLRLVQLAPAGSGRRSFSSMARRLRPRAMPAPPRCRQLMRFRSSGWKRTTWRRNTGGCRVGRSTSRPGQARTSSMALFTILPATMFSTPTRGTPTGAVRRGASSV